MTRAIEASIFGKSQPPALPVLSAPEWLRLASHLGQFSETFQPARPGQIANLHKLEQATAVMSGVSKLLNNWPANFHAVLAEWESLDGFPVQKMAALAARRGLPVFYHRPSLVEHLGAVSAWGGPIRRAVDFEQAVSAENENGAPVS